MGEAILSPGSWLGSEAGQALRQALGRQGHRGEEA
jgi:hypothetical protein